MSGKTGNEIRTELKNVQVGDVIACNDPQANDYNVHRFLVAYIGADLFTVSKIILYGYDITHTDAKDSIKAVGEEEFLGVERKAILSPEYISSVLTGVSFEQNYADKEICKDWHGSEECATLAKHMFENKDQIDNEEKYDDFMHYAVDGIANGDIKIEDDINGAFHRGFIAGEVFSGAYENDNNQFWANIVYAEEEWQKDSELDNPKYGYFMDLCNDINNGTYTDLEAEVER